MHVTEELAEWEDSRSMDRKRDWFTIDAALAQLALHKPVQRHYLTQLKNSKSLSPSGTTPAGGDATATAALLLTSVTAAHPGSGIQQPQTTSTNWELGA